MRDADCTPGREPRSVAASSFSSFLADFNAGLYSVAAVERSWLVCLSVENVTVLFVVYCPNHARNPRVYSRPA